jgi:hypothetical protein
MARHVEDLNLALHALTDPTCCSKRHGGLSRRRATAGSASFASLYGHRRRYVGSTPVYPTSLIS